MNARGFVIATVNDTKRALGSNTLVENYYDFVIRAQMGAESLTRVVFANTTIPVTPALARLSGVVAGVDLHLTGDLRPEVVRDSDGLRSIGIWRATYVPADALTYNTLGLLSSSGMLVAALSVGDTTVNPGDTVSVQWTIASRGRL